MDHYYFNSNADDKGRHEVHKENCSYLPSVSNREYIGYESSCHDAINKAQSKYPNKIFDGCFWCCRECNKG